jgi:hypothetical protein
VKDRSWVGKVAAAAREASAAVRDELRSPEARQGLAEGVGTRGIVHAFMDRLKEAPGEIGMELQRLGTQGAMELASAIFNGHAFVPYGPGQYTPSPGHGVHGPEQGQQQRQEQGRQEPEQQRERGGREM